MVLNTNNQRPIKIVYDDNFVVESSGEYDITISRRATLSELAALFGLDVCDIYYDFNIGIYTFNE